MTYTSTRPGMQAPAIPPAGFPPELPDTMRDVCGRFDKFVVQVHESDERLDELRREREAAVTKDGQAILAAAQEGAKEPATTALEKADAALAAEERRHIALTEAAVASHAAAVAAIEEHRAEWARKVQRDLESATRRYAKAGRRSRGREDAHRRPARDGSVA